MLVLIAVHTRAALCLKVKELRQLGRPLGSASRFTLSADAAPQRLLSGRHRKFREWGSGRRHGAGKIARVLRQQHLA